MKRVTLRKNEHQYVIERLSAYVDQALSAQERMRVQTHLEQCTACRQELESLLWMKRLLRQTPTIPVPRSFVVRQADLDAMAVTARQRPLMITRWATALVALLLVVVLLGDLLSGRPMAMKSRSSIMAGPEQVAFEQYGTPEAEMTMGYTSTEVESQTVEVQITVVVEAEKALPTTEVRAMRQPEVVQETETVDTQATGQAVSLLAVEATPSEVPPEVPPGTWRETPPTPSPESAVDENPTMTPAIEASEVTPVAAWSEPLPDETSAPSGHAALEGEPSRLIWRVAEIGLGVALVVLIVLWAVMRKRI